MEDKYETMEPVDWVKGVACVIGFLVIIAAVAIETLG